MSENPFAEPDDNDHTIIRPGLPRSKAPPAPGPSAPPRPAQPAAVTGPDTLTLTGATPLLTAASPLLQLLARLRNTLTSPDPGNLRERAVAEVRAFEARARAAQVPADQLRAAHYALCASLDDVVLSTPWGAGGGWDTRSLVSTFHQNVQGGEGFFDLLGKLRQHPGRFLPVLELMYVCLSLGFQGRYRLSPRGPAEIDRLREETYALIQNQRPPAATHELSPQWQGVSAPYRPARFTVPAWAAGATALGLLAALFAWTTLGANRVSDEAYTRLAAAPPDHMPRILRPVSAGPAPPQAPPQPDRLQTFLKPEVDAGLVAVLGTTAAPLIRIRGSNMFLSGNAELQPRFAPLLERIGAALRDEPGQIRVVGYTDNQAIRTVQFPSNFQLSAARAAVAAAAIGRGLGGTGRIRSEGLADANPIASNATLEGRDQNRRIEVILERRP